MVEDPAVDSHRENLPEDSTLAVVAPHFPEDTAVEVVQHCPDMEAAMNDSAEAAVAKSGTGTVVLHHMVVVAANP